MTHKELLNELWKRKGGIFSHNGKIEIIPSQESFAHVKLTQDVIADKYTMKAGDTVLVTMFSRFEDIGIRGVNIDKITHGYHARVKLDKIDPETWQWKEPEV